jgi:hypothetical protein
MRIPMRIRDAIMDLVIKSYGGLFQNFPSGFWVFIRKKFDPGYFRLVLSLYSLLSIIKCTYLIFASLFTPYRTYFELKQV